MSEIHSKYGGTDRLHNYRSTYNRNLSVSNGTAGRRVLYVLHLAHRDVGRLGWIVVDGRLEGLKISMVRTVVRWFGCDLSRKLGTVRLPTWKLSCAHTIIAHRRKV